MANCNKCKNTVLSADACKPSTKVFGKCTSRSCPPLKKNLRQELECCTKTVKKCFTVKYQIQDKVCAEKTCRTNCGKQCKTGRGADCGPGKLVFSHKCANTVSDCKPVKAAKAKTKTNSGCGCCH